MFHIACILRCKFEFANISPNTEYISLTMKPNCMKLFSNKWYQICTNMHRNGYLIRTVEHTDLRSRWHFYSIHTMLNIPYFCSWVPEKYRNQFVLRCIPNKRGNLRILSQTLIYYLNLKINFQIYLSWEKFNTAY